MHYDAVIIGSGPNGLSAAITLAQQNLNVLVIEAKEIVGGGLRSAELTLPGFIHDICSAIHPLAYSSPLFNTLPLNEYGLKWIHPDVCLAHPLDDGTSVLLAQSLEDTIYNLGEDGKRYKKVFKPLIDKWKYLLKDILTPLNLHHLFSLSEFGFHAIQSAKIFTENNFNGERARSLFIGMAGHSFLPLNKLITAATGMVLGISAHHGGWPIAKGGSQMIANALTSYFESLGGKLETNFIVKDLGDLPSARVYLFDVSPKQLIEIAGKKFSGLYSNQLKRYRYGPGVFKVDWALSSKIPFKSADCLKAGTVHIGNTYNEIINSEEEVWKNNHPEKPFIIMAQQSLFDNTRAPSGKHTAWAYCHVPHGSTFDMTERIENQIERFAPGFKDCILARHSMNTHNYQEYNNNLVGGDINGGVMDLWQLYTRPAVRFSSYSTPAKNIYICSASTPPGGGVHGMCGYNAAKSVLKNVFKIERKESNG